MRIHLPSLAMTTATLAVMTLGSVAAAPTAGPTFADAGVATIHPGVQTVTAGAGQCTSNFVFTNSAGDVFLGQAAHCAGTGGQTETNGCDSGSLPLMTRVDVQGAQHPGTLVYSSWLAMQARNEPNANACAYNDFALVELDPRDVASTNPSVPSFGGPVGIADSVGSGSSVYSYGNSSLRGGLTLLSPKTGISTGQGGNGWTHTVYTITPGIPGDSGSGFLDAEGRAMGTLSTLAIAPIPLSNGVGDLSRELAYARANFDPSLKLVLGDVPFSAGLPLIGGLTSSSSSDGNLLGGNLLGGLFS